MKVIDNLRGYSFARKYREAEITEVGGDVALIKRIKGVFVSSNRGVDKLRDDVYSLTPIHGRSAIYIDSDNTFYAVKGSGWSFGGVPILESPKESQLVFGLFAKKLAQRELEVSIELERHALRVGRVVGWALLNSEILFENNYKNTTREMEPSLLYTKLIYPLRVADMAYMKYEDRIQAINEASKLSGWDCDGPDSYVVKFLETLAITVDKIHCLGGVFDGLFYDNITLACELLDFEWFYMPGYALPDGSSNENINARQKKSLIYMAEIGYQLSCFLGLKFNFLDVVNILKKTNPSCENLKIQFIEIEMASDI